MLSSLLVFCFILLLVFRCNLRLSRWVICFPSSMRGGEQGSKEKYLHCLITPANRGGLIWDLTHMHNFKYHKWFLNNQAIIYTSKWMFFFQKYLKGKILMLFLKCSEEDSSKKAIFKFVSLKVLIPVWLLKSVTLFYSSASCTSLSFVNIQNIYQLVQSVHPPIGTDPARRRCEGLLAGSQAVK